ncbi:MAG TPA: hypothetical protein VGR48_11265 [Terriglobales bacterium]|nr:hypothetical protein [Terriglobales bacterium]
MNVTVFSESRFATASADGGLEVTRKIWQDMRQSPGSLWKRPALAGRNSWS